MKTLINAFGGALQVQEQGGDFYLAFNGSLGGGNVAGWISGQGSIKLGTGSVGLKAAEALLNHLIPAAAMPVAQAIENALNGIVSEL
jgi:hypothetical protein